MLATARYYDGALAEGWEVTLHAAAGALAIVHAASGRELARWPVAEIDPIGDLDTEPFRRLRRRGGGDARLVIEDAGLRATVAGLDRRLSSLRGAERAIAPRLAVWSGALALLLGLAWMVIQHAPQHVAPLVPHGIQEAIGNDVYDQFVGDFRECRSPEGTAALKRIVVRLEQAADYGHPIRVTVVQQSMVNAFALPGGRVVIFSKLIDEAEGPHELAAVLAHEFGHVVLYHSMQALLRHFGTDLVLKIVTGGMSGSLSNVVSAAEMLLVLRHGREAERESDTIGLEMLKKLGWRQDGLATFFGRMMKEQGGDLAKRAGIFSSHPATDERIAATQRPSTGAMPISEPEWKALRAICR